MQIDKRGSFGERFFQKVLFELYNRRIEIKYKDGDQGDWDLEINGFKFEIKTSSQDVNGKFQNEGIKHEGDYYGILFLCIAPNDLYIKFIKRLDIPFETLHDRRKGGKQNQDGKITGSGYKWDFKLTEVSKIENMNDIMLMFDRIFPEVFRKIRKKKT